MSGHLPKLYTDGEAAVFLRVKPCTVRNLRVRGQLGYVTVGRRVFHTHEHLVEYLERQKVAASIIASVRPEAPRRTPGRPLPNHAAITVREAVSELAERTFAPTPRRLLNTGKDAA